MEKMKIFAKRKKKDTAKKVEATTTGPRTTFSSDPVVEELLKLDPSEWNSKQKRMVKRYQQRKTQEEGDDNQQSAEDNATNTVNVGDKAEDGTQNEKENTPNASSSSSDSDNSDNDENDDQDKSDSLEISSNIAEKEEETAPESTKIPVESETEKVDPTHDIWKQLEQLNSKMKRTLSRKLDREGVSVLAEVQAEANRLLGKDEDKTSPAHKKRQAEQVVGESNGKSKKKRKKDVDWSSLPPEERLRREEQRRLQKEAAERRAKGEDSSGVYKHPLNSERRRANRRKPKWKNTFKIEEKKNHNASGFLARRHKPF